MENKVFKAHRTLMQMLGDRNYQIAENHSNMNPESFKEKLVQISAEASGADIDFQKLNTIYEKKKNPDAMIEDPEAVADLMDPNKIYVCWQVKEEKVNAELVKRIQIFCT
jgi:hypothetical protein